MVGGRTYRLFYIVLCILFLIVNSAQRESKELKKANEQMQRSMEQMQRSMEEMKIENRQAINIGGEMDQEIET